MAGVSHKDIRGEREAELIQRYQGGDRHAGEILLRAHAPLIAHYARKYGRGRHDLSPEDLLAEGQIGFLKGVARFDATRGAQLPTYACHWIRQSVERAKIDTGTTIRVPVNQYAQGLGRDDSRGRAAYSALHLSRLDEPIGGKGDDATLADLCADGDDPERTVADEEQQRVTREALERVLGAMPPKLAEILRRRAEGETLERIAQTQGVTREAVRQRETKARDMAQRLLRRMALADPFVEDLALG